MNRHSRHFAVVASATLLALAGCENPPSKEKVGTVGGAVVGGVVGSTIGGGTGRTVAIVALAVGGAMLGSHVGKRLDEADRLKAAQALETAPTGQQVSWKNPDTGAQYSLTPTKTYEGAQPCRDFTVNANIDGKPENVKGKACRQPDGTWKAD